MLYHRSDLGDRDTIAFEPTVELEVFNETPEVVPLEVWLSLLQEGFDIGQVDQVRLLAKFELEKMEDKILGVHIGIIHV